jgi:hypothetical protein
MCPHTGRRRAQRLATALTVAALGSGAIASAASAASLKLTVPSQVKKGKGYAIQVNGSYQRRELTGKAYLITAIQFSNHSCKDSAQAENRSSDFVQWIYAPAKEQNHPVHVGVFETKSPFTKLNGFTAGDLGSRHVCSWLYPKFIHPSDTVHPIARADAKYRVTKA